MTLYAFLNVIMLVLVCMAIGVLIWCVRTMGMYRALAKAKNLPMDVFMINRLAAREFLFRTLVVFAAIGVLLAAFITNPGAV